MRIIKFESENSGQTNASGQDDGIPDVGFFSVTLGIAQPGSGQFQAIDCVLDSGMSDAISLTPEIAKKMGLKSSGTLVADTPGGSVETKTALVDLKLWDTGENIFLRSVTAHISDIGFCLIGIRIIKLFDIQIKDGKIIHFVPNKSQLDQIGEKRE
ncbi:MAG: aspartyl protease family protein [Bdellovibrionales bacterium]|nr:aspartyl protease family protein [Bdellovibrionales bacterium]